MILSMTFERESSDNSLSGMASVGPASFVLPVAPGAGDMLPRAAVFESTGCATMISLEYPGAEVLSIIVVADFHVVVDVLIFLMEMVSSKLV